MKSAKYLTTLFGALLLLSFAGCSTSTCTCEKGALVENTPIVEASNTIATDSTPMQEPIAELFVADEESSPEEETQEPVPVDMELAPLPICVDEPDEEPEPPQATEPLVESEPSEPAFMPEPPVESEPIQPSAPPKSISAPEPEPPITKPESPIETPSVESEPPAEPPVVDPAPDFDVTYWIAFAQNYAHSVGLWLESSAVDCWDNPITAGPYSQMLERDIQSRLNRYVREEVTDVWIWTEPIGDGQYNIYIGYA